MSGRATTIAILFCLFALLLALSACGSSYYRVRGTSEIHTGDCPFVRRADRGGAISASSSDGPPCHKCRREEALEWAEDQY